MSEFLRDHKAGLWISGTGLVCLVVILTFIATQISEIHESVYSENATNARRAAIEREFKKSCDNIIVLDELRRCFDRIISAEWDTQRAQEDLKAQKDVARYALWMFNATVGLGILSLVVAGFGIYYVRETLNATRVLSTAENRAWIKIKDVRIVGGLSISREFCSLRIKTEIENIGKSPAFHIFSAEIGIPDIGGSDRHLVYIGEARKMYNEIVYIRTAVLFPEESDTIDHDVIFEYDPNRQRVSPSETLEAVYDAVLYICIFYKVVGDADTHETIRKYHIHGLNLGAVARTKSENLSISPSRFHMRIAN